VDEKNKAGETPLSLAVLSGEVAVAEELIAKGADKGWIDANTNSLVHRAVNGDRISMLAFLLQKELRVDGENKNGNTPLTLVRSQAAAELLVSRGADVRAPLSSGTLPFEAIYARAGYGDEVVAALRYLITRGAITPELKAKTSFQPLYMTLVRAIDSSSAAQWGFAEDLLKSGYRGDDFSNRFFDPTRPLFFGLRDLRAFDLLEKYGTNFSATSLGRKNLRAVLAEEIQKWEEELARTRRVGNEEQIRAAEARLLPRIEENRKVDDWLRARGVVGPS
jgi:hypothetical protein